MIVWAWHKRWRNFTFLCSAFCFEILHLNKNDLVIEGVRFFVFLNQHFVQLLLITKNKRREMNEPGLDHEAVSVTDASMSTVAITRRIPQQQDVLVCVCVCGRGIWKKERGWMREVYN